LLIKKSFFLDFLRFFSYKEETKNYLSAKIMRIKFHRTEAKEVVLFKANEKILSEQVFLIDETGEQLGVMATKLALEMAKEVDLDLVEVNPKANPPVAKIVDLGQLKYERDKKAHKQKMQQKKVDVKAIRLSFRISDHDLELRLNQSAKFLGKGDKIKIELPLKGRERQYPQKAAAIMNDFLAKLQSIEDLNVEAEQPLTKQGGRFSMILVNKKPS
jgi:translation initiation factor IF-3